MVNSKLPSPDLLVRFKPKCKYYNKFDDTYSVSSLILSSFKKGIYVMAGFTTNFVSIDQRLEEM